MKNYILLFILFFISPSLFAQIQLRGYCDEDIHPALWGKRWPARWISVPGEPANVYGVYHFRKTFEMESVPERFMVHVSADNRYKLYVNGHFISLGPTRGDIYNWNFETVNLAPYLTEGKNVLAAVVWNYAEKKPVAQISFNQTGFLLQGNGETENIINTNQSWVCLKNNAYAPWEEGVRGYYVAGPGELLNAAVHPWGWEKPEYDDTDWLPAQQGIEGGMKGARDYAGRLLVPSPIPPMDMHEERLKAVSIAEGIKTPIGFPEKQVPLTIPANTQVRLLLDNQQLTTGYLSLLFSKGKKAEITIGYAEALYESGHTKGNRNETVGKDFVGYADKIIVDGGKSRLFTSLWWRTWRYINLQIQTGDEPLVIENIYGTFSGYPFEKEFTFSAPGHEELNKMLDIGWLTARLCANETYMDCPYYEQLQYFGDTRIQAMITMYNTRDPYMVKNALEQGRQSIVADGITMSRYPSSLHQFISSFSLWWICMGHDYWMHKGDEEYMKTLLPAFRGVLSWYEQWLKPDYSLGYVPHWFFVDWAGGFDYGEPVREEDGNSSFQDLIYILTLEAAAEMEAALGLPAITTHYNKMADGVRKGFHVKYWDANKGLFADTHDHRSYSQHVNSLAILAGMVSGENAKSVMMRTLTDPDLIQATIYFRYYVHQALSKAGMGDDLLENLQIWRDQMKLGLTTWAEMPEPSRSDCHAWGASPNIEFYRILLGISSDAPGFSKVRIAPALGKLKEVSGSMPHPVGTITAAYKLDKRGELTARIILPEGVSGTFIWKGKEVSLKGGEQVLRFK